MSTSKPFAPHKGRAAVSNSEGRFAKQISVREDDGWTPDPDAPAPKTVYHHDAARTLISRNSSPDIPFSQSINPYRGCEHGCIYCFARPTHSYLDLSPGLDFETQIFCKDEAPELLRAELSKPSYVCEPIALGVNTDAYQPVEAEKKITRRLLEVMAEFRQPVSIITKSTLITRDIDLLADLAKDGLCEVVISITTLDRDLKRLLEPRAASGEARLATLEALAKAEIPIGVLCAPVIPAINDMEMERIMEAARERGATYAGYIFLRLPHELVDVFQAWLHTHYPQRAEHVMSIVRQARGGKDYDSAFFQRMKGQGVFAELLRQRFKLAFRKLGYSHATRGKMRTDLFRVPGKPEQGSLF